MKLNEILNEGLLDTIKKKLGEFKGKVFSSMNALLLRFKKHPNERLTTIETFRIPDISRTYEARVDTGATRCSLHAEDIVVDFNYVTFKHAGARHKIKLEKLKNVKSASGNTSRPVIMLSYTWNDKIYRDIETTLIDRSKLKFKLLIGRNLIDALKLPVHINDRDRTEAED